MPPKKRPASGGRAAASKKPRSTGKELREEIIEDFYGNVSVDPSIKTDVSSMEVGRSVLIRGHLEKLWIGRIANIDKLKDTKFLNVQWFTGEVGENKSFQISERWIKKSDTVHLDCVICHFEFDSSKDISKILEKKLLAAAAKHKEAKERIERNPPPPSKLQKQEGSSKKSGSPSKKEHSSSAVDPSIKTDPLTMEVGRCVMIRGHMEKLWIGRVSNIQKLEDTHFFNVQWFTGEVGTNKTFQIAERWIKKSDNVHIDCVICHFEFDSSKPIAKQLEKNLLNAAEKHKEAQERAKRNPPPPSKMKK